MTFAIVTSERRGQIWVLEVAGELDLASRDRFVQTGARAVETDVSAIEVDMTAVSFLDSTGIGALIELRNLATTYGQQVRVVAQSDQVTKVLTVTGLLELFTASARQP